MQLSDAQCGIPGTWYYHYYDESCENWTEHFHSWRVRVIDFQRAKKQKQTRNVKRYKTELEVYANPDWISFSLLCTMQPWSLLNYWTCDHCSVSKRRDSTILIVFHSLWTVSKWKWFSLRRFPDTVLSLPTPPLCLGPYRCFRPSTKTLKSSNCPCSRPCAYENVSVWTATPGYEAVISATLASLLCRTNSSFLLCSSTTSRMRSVRIYSGE